jgi:anti-sigma factor RsiW
MTCRKIERLIQGCVDDTASPRERAAVEAHVDECSACARSLAQSRRLASLLSGAGERRVSAGFEAGLRARLEEVRPASPLGAWWERCRLQCEWRLHGPTMVAAGGLAAVALALTAAPRVATEWAREGEERRYVASALQRHQELQRADSRVDWDALDSSIELSTGSVVTE